MSVMYATTEDAAIPPFGVPLMAITSQLQSPFTSSAAAMLIQAQAGYADNHNRR
jgi:hypothetical protein